MFNAAMTADMVAKKKRDEADAATAAAAATAARASMAAREFEKRRDIRALQMPVPQGAVQKWNWPSMAGRSVWFTGLSLGLAAIGASRLALGPEESIQSFLDVIAESDDRAIDLGVPVTAIAALGGRGVSGSASPEEVASPLVQAALGARSSLEEVVFPS